MRILLINPSRTGGHFNEYKILFTKAFSELGHEVLHFSQSTENPIKNGPSISNYAKKFNYISNLCIKYRKYGIAQWRIRNKALINLHVLYEYIDHLQNSSNRPDLLFFAFLDESLGQYLTKWDIDLKLNIPFSGLLFSPPDVRIVPNKFFNKGPFDHYNILKSKRCISVGVLSEEAIQEFSKLLNKPVIELPDVVSVPKSIQDNSLGEFVRNRASGRFIIGIWGALEQRKGTSEFLQMCLKQSSDKYFFVMGGRIHNKNNWPENDRYILNKSISGNMENLLIIDQWLSDDDLLSGIQSCDLLFAAYPGFRFSSGIVGKAAALGVPVLVNDCFVMAKRVNHYNLGFVKKEQEDASQWLSDNILKINKLHNSTSFKEGCTRYCERYGYEQWCKSLELLIKPQNHS